jgi:hypothetical protein
MTVRWAMLAAVALAGLLTLPAGAASRHTHRDVSVGSTGVLLDSNGNPIIMRGYRSPPREPRQAHPPKHSRRPVKIPRGSGGSLSSIPPVNPSPNAGPSPQQIIEQGKAVQPYRPPPIESFGDRVTGCIHSYPLNKGLGNNPTGQQAYIRQCANR